MPITLAGRAYLAALGLQPDHPQALANLARLAAAGGGQEASQPAISP
jgi:hypothetical protein